MTDKEKIQLLVATMKNVTYCFDSVVGDGMNERHPSCREYIVNVIKMVEERDE